MAPTAIQDSPSAPSWFTPKRLPLIFMDQGAIASNGVNGSISACDDSGICTSGTGIQGDFDLNNFQDGVLSSAFIVGILVASPIFASLAKSHNPFRLIGFGLSVWTLAAAGCGCSVDFWSITICRMMVGVGHASIVSLAPPFIDDNAPATQVGDYFSWRYAFWGESLLMFPFAVFGFVMKPLQLRENDDEGINSSSGFKVEGFNNKITSVITISRGCQNAFAS